MKITQGQYFEIEEFFMDKCRLVEEGFIQEMTDHFVDGIETTMTDSVSFEESLSLVVNDFGGIRAIRKMEWSFQKAFMKKQVREWWMVAREYVNRPKLYRSLVLLTAVTALIFWIKPGKFTSLVSVFPGFLSGLFMPLLVIVTIFMIQRHLRELKSIGLVNAQRIVNRLIPFVFFTVLFLLFVMTTVFCDSLIIREILCSLLGTAGAVLTLATLEYTSKREPAWYQPYKLS